MIQFDQFDQAKQSITVLCINLRARRTREHVGHKAREAQEHIGYEARRAREHVGNEARDHVGHEACRA